MDTDGGVKGPRNEQATSSTVNGRKWMLIRKEYARRETTERGNERTDRDTGTSRGKRATFITDSRESEGGRDGATGEIEVAGPLVVAVLDDGRLPEGWSEKRKNTVQIREIPWDRNLRDL